MCVKFSLSPMRLPIFFTAFSLGSALFCSSLSANEAEKAPDPAPDDTAAPAPAPDDTAAPAPATQPATQSVTQPVTPNQTMPYPAASAPIATQNTMVGKENPLEAARRNSWEARRQQMEERLRATMVNFGLTDAFKQDAIITYLAEDETGKAVLRESSRRLMGAVRRNVEPARLRDLISVYKATLDADKERRLAAQIALDAKVGYSLDPRLEAMLWLFGVLGESNPGIPFNQMAPRGPGNRGYGGNPNANAAGANHGQETRGNGDATKREDKPKPEEAEGAGQTPENKEEKTTEPPNDAPNPAPETITP